jgi:hypothetical protein
MSLSVISALLQILRAGSAYLATLCRMSAWRNSEVIKVNALPLRRLTPLKAKYSTSASESKSQKTRETRIHVMITKLIFLTCNASLKTQ